MKVYTVRLSLALGILNAEKPPAKDMTWQELEDTLVAKGLNVRRRNGKSGMWFHVGGGNPDVVNLDAMKPFGWGNYFVDSFLVTKFDSAEGATKEMNRLKDVRQQDSYAWGVFLFESEPGTLGTLKKTLK